ncbi:MAG: hypothetical protein RLN75_02625, partial [Longimicrobiales bacterium]
MVHDAEGSRRKMRHLGITAGSLGLLMAGVLALNDSPGAAVHLGVVLALVVVALVLGGRSATAAMLLAVSAVGVDIWFG